MKIILPILYLTIFSTFLVSEAHANKLSKGVKDYIEYYAPLVKRIPQYTYPYATLYKKVIHTWPDILADPEGEKELESWINLVDSRVIEVEECLKAKASLTDECQGLMRKFSKIVKGLDPVFYWEYFFPADDKYDQRGITITKIDDEPHFKERIEKEVAPILVAASRKHVKSKDFHLKAFHEGRLEMVREIRGQEALDFPILKYHELLFRTNRFPEGELPELVESELLKHHIERKGLDTDFSYRDLRLLQVDEQFVYFYKKVLKQQLCSIRETGLDSKYGGAPGAVGNGIPGDRGLMFIAPSSLSLTKSDSAMLMLKIPLKDTLKYNVTALQLMGFDWVLHGAVLPPEFIYLQIPKQEAQLISTDSIKNGKGDVFVPIRSVNCNDFAPPEPKKEVKAVYLEPESKSVVNYDCDRLPSGVAVAISKGELRKLDQSTKKSTFGFYNFSTVEATLSLEDQPPGTFIIYPKAKGINTYVLSIAMIDSKSRVCVKSVGVARESDLMTKLETLKSNEIIKQSFR